MAFHSACNFVFNFTLLFILKTGNFEKGLAINFTEYTLIPDFILNNKYCPKDYSVSPLCAPEEFPVNPN